MDYKSTSSWFMARQHFQQQLKQQHMNNNNHENHDANDATKTTTPAPLYITIGPPCCGKTSWVKNKQKQQQQKQKNNNYNDNKNKLMPTTQRGQKEKENQQQQKEKDNKQHNDDHHDIIDVSIDDQRGVYWKIPFDNFNLISSLRNYDDDNHHDDCEVKQYSKQFIYGKTIKERIVSNELKELCIVLHFLFNIDEYDPNTPMEFLSALLTLQQDKKLGLSFQHQMLWEIFEEYVLDYRQNIKTPPLPPTTIGLYVREAIFTSPSSSLTTTLKTAKNTTTTTTRSGIERAIDTMRNDIKLNQSIVWSNTNTRPLDYKMALQIAYEQKRPVHYIVYYDNDYDTEDNSVDDNDDMILQQIRERQNKQQLKQQLNRIQNQHVDILFDLNITFYNTLLKKPICLHNGRNECYKELIRRNIKRFIKTGRYIPCQVIYDMKIQSKQLIKHIMKQLYNNNDTNQNNQYDNQNNNTNDDHNNCINNNNNNNITKVQLDCMLTQLNQYEMNMNDHTVYPLL